MMTAHDRGNGGGPWLAALATLVVFIVLQAVAGVIWGSRLDTRVSFMEGANVEQDKKIQMIDDRGTRNLPLLDQKVTALTDRIDGLTKRIDQLSSELKQHSEATATGRTQHN